MASRKEIIKKETPEERWSRWDRMLNEKKHIQMITEFDFMVKGKEQVLVGDLVRREQALEYLGIISFNKQKAIYESVKRKY